MNDDRAVVLLIEVKKPMSTACVRDMREEGTQLPDGSYILKPIWKLPAETAESKDAETAELQGVGADEVTASRGADEETGVDIPLSAWSELLSEPRNGARGFHIRVLMHASIDFASQLAEIGYESDHALEVKCFTYDQMVKMAAKGKFLRDHIELLERARVIQ